MSLASTLASPAAKLGAYAVVLALALAGGALVGAAVGPEPTTPAPGHATHAEPPIDPPAPMSEELPGGLAVARDGYALVLEPADVAADEPTELAFTIVGPGGATDFAVDVEHERELHLVVVSRDLVTYAHLHPERDAAGRWTVDLPALAPGSYRVLADVTPTGHDGLVLGTDLTVPGTVAVTPEPTATSAVSVDGYDVRIEGELSPGADSTLTATVTRDGEPVTDLQPYLGALGHLVAIRDGDLAYLHVHPLDETAGTGGPTVPFAVDVPSAGTYALYFEFAHGGDVHTATFVVTTHGS